MRVLPRQGLLHAPRMARAAHGRACLPLLARECEQSTKHSFADVNLRLGCTLRLYKSVNMKLFGLPKSHPLIAASELQFRGGGRDIPFFTFRPDKLFA